MGNSSRTSKIIKASPERLFNAFWDPSALIACLAPGEMTGKIDAFDPRVGGGYRMSLFYPPDEQSFAGKTSHREDRADVRFVALKRSHRIVEAVTFDATDSAFRGEMTMVATFDGVPDGTKVTLSFANLPPGLRPEDNETGSRLSLEQLARYCE